VAAVTVPGLLPARHVVLPACIRRAPPTLAHIDAAHRHRDGDQPAAPCDSRKDPLGMPRAQCGLKGQALEFNDEQRHHATRWQAEHEQTNEQDDDLPVAAGLAGRGEQLREVGTRNARRRHEVSREEVNVAGAASDNCGDPLGGLLWGYPYGNAASSTSSRTPRLLCRARS